MEKNKKDKKESDSDPRPMALTVKAVVLNKDNEILILKRAKDVCWNVGSFDLPGGHIGKDESFKDAIIREVKEETGLETVFGEVIDVVEFPKDNPLFKEEKRGIRCICYSETDEVKLSSEHEEYKWLPIDKSLDEFSEKDGFENEKRETILKAQEFLEKERARENWKRMAADFENYKKRQEEARKDIIAFSNQNMILEILPVLDNFHASTDHIPEEQKNSPWVVGIMHIQKQLEKILEDNGVSEIKIKIGDEFNPESMEAVENKENGKEESKNIVKKIVMKGYKIDGKVIRAARVVVE